MPSTISRPVLVLFGVVLAAASVSVGYWEYRQTDAEMRSDLAAAARTCAVAFDRDEIRLLSGSAIDLRNPVYVNVKDRLARLQTANPRVRLMFLLRYSPETNELVELADSRPVGVSEAPGQLWIEMGNRPGLQTVLQEGIATTEGPLSGATGEWITAYATLSAGPGRNAPGPREILGIEAAAGPWRRAVMGMAVASGFYVLLAGGLPLVLLEWVRRRHALTRTIIKLTAAIEQCHSAILITDNTGRIEYVNQGLCRQTGYRSDEMVGHKWKEFFPASDPPAKLEEMVALVGGGQPWTGDWVNWRKDGSFFPARHVVTPVRDGAGKPLCYITVIDDVTETRRVEAELRFARDAAEAAGQAKSRFLATMGHELRTPLNGIVGFTRLLLDTPLNSEQREYLLTIRTSSQALVDLTGDLLDLARIEAGRMRLEPEPCDPQEVLEAVLALFCEPAAVKQIELLVRVTPAVSERVVTDPGRLRQILVNLVGNAVKFTYRGEVEVTLDVPTNADGGKATDRLEFKVRDTGIGISPEDQAKLFEPFSQVATASARRVGGVGLGLAICRHLAKLMGGTITMESAAGAGSTFTLVIQAAPVPAPPRELHSEAVARRVGILIEHRALAATIVKMVEEIQALPVRVTELELAEGTYDALVVDCDAERSEAMASEGWTPPCGWVPARTIGLISPLTPSARRQALRAAIGQVVTKPVFTRLLSDALSRVLTGPGSG